ncbi:MAG: orotidine-5'-phosphate decarboxylase [Lactobacillaceae bacterium]|jgi:orotidine-5'-phosphate decarboxylase|nr:orotidine-5'-phosphate decarboxylase [Lactobacillaceae bacterium]
MNKQALFEQIIAKRSFLCVGLDTDVKKIPECLDGDMLGFNQAIIDATAPYAVCFKPNVAFYESMGTYGWDVLKRTIGYIKENYPEIFVIADAKRGDIGNTSEMYAKTFFENLPADAVTVAPYMGKDSVAPFLKFEDKFAVLLALTSNEGSDDFQMQTDAVGCAFYEKVLQTSKEWGNEDNMMYVVGATKAQMLEGIRRIVPNHFLLVPGVGAQGGSLREVAKYGMNSQCGLLVNSSRGIIYASKCEDFATRAAMEAKALQEEMNLLLEDAEI